MAWKHKASKQSDGFLTDNKAAITDAALVAVSSSSAAKLERMQISRSITEAWFGEGPDTSIAASVDTPGETREIADWLNYSVAPDVYQKSVYWQWSFCDASELSKLKMKSDFALLSYMHLTAKLSIEKLSKMVSKGNNNA